MTKIAIIGEPDPATLAQLLAEADARYDRPPCMECGAETLEEAEKLCNCGGDKDDCHGCHLWPVTD